MDRKNKGLKTEGDEEPKRGHELDLSQIPPLPASSLKIMSIIFNDEVDIDKLIKTIKQDVGLSSEVMKAANSPLYKTSESTDSLSSAIMKLGLDIIKKIILSTCLLSDMKSKLPKESYALLLSHTLASASAAQILASKAKNINQETAFLIALFLNLGLLVCANLYPQEFTLYQKEARERRLQLTTLIEEGLNVNLNALSLLLAKKWQLPEIIIKNIESIKEVRKYSEHIDSDASNLSSILLLSSMAADVYCGTSTLLCIEKFKTNFALFMGKKKADPTDILKALSEEFNLISSLLSLNTEKQPDYTKLLLKANQELLKINDKYELMYKELSDKNKEMHALTNELDKKNKILQKLVTTDPLTLLYNRRYLENNLKRLASESKRYGTHLSIAMLDIDFFKQINDQHGHQAGDNVLIAIARCLENSLRQTDICARYGGEEFIVILPHTTLENACTAAEHYRKNIENLSIQLDSNTPENKIKVTTSIGLSSLNQTINTPEILINTADSFLYKAKESGRNCVCF